MLDAMWDTKIAMTQSFHQETYNTLQTLIYAIIEIRASYCYGLEENIFTNLQGNLGQTLKWS